MRPFEELEHRNPKILFVGDSHPGNAVSLAELDSNYAVLSQGSDTIRHMLLKLDYAIKKKPTIQCVVVPLEWHTLSQYRYVNKSFSRDLFYTDNTHLVRELFDTSLLGYYKEWIGRWVPLILGKSWEKYFLILLGRRDQFDIRWEAIETKGRVNRASARLREQLSGQIVREEMVDLLDRFISFCSAKKIKIVGIIYPLSVEYIQLSHEYDIAKLESTYRERNSDFLFVLDYRDLFVGDNEYFTNADHLSASGSKVFTRTLRKDIEKRLPLLFKAKAASTNRKRQQGSTNDSTDAALCNSYEP